MIWGLLNCQNRDLGGFIGLMEKGLKQFKHIKRIGNRGKKEDLEDTLILQGPFPFNLIISPNPGSDI